MTLLSHSPFVSAEPVTDVTRTGPLADVVGADLEVPFLNAEWY
jgi:hypothetical protein